MASVTSSEKKNLQKLSGAWHVDRLRLRRYQADPDRLLHADLAGLKAYWGGEKAAELLASYLHPERFTIYVETPRQSC